MTVNKPNRHGSADGAKARIESGLTSFSWNKAALLYLLRNAHGTRIASEPFDAEKSWADLTRVARLHLGFKDGNERFAKQNPAKPLGELATTLSRACTLVKMAMQEGGDFALLRAWRAEEHMTLTSALPFDEAGSTHIVKELTKALRTLAKLEKVARRAFENVRRKSGRPKGPTKLPELDTIIGLAGVYRRSTGLKPAAGKGRFADFANKCLKALGHNFKKTSLDTAIKRARHQAALQAAALNKLSPFARG
jgi:hypothetical protein